MIKDRVAFDLPAYDGLLAGHYARGQGYGRRREGGTDDWLLILTLAGKGRIGSINGDFAAVPGTLFLIAPGTTHDYGTAREAEEWEILWVHFHPPTTWLEFLQWPLAAPGIHRLALPRQDELEPAFREVIRLATSPGPLRKPFAMNALERLLLLAESQRPAAGANLDERIKAVIEYVHTHLNHPLSLAELSARVHLSPSRFSHLFRRETGLAPGQYLTVQRLQRAQSLLKRTTLSIAEIAGEVGMDPFYLTLRFKRETGLSPRAYRRSPGLPPELRCV